MPQIFDNISQKLLPTLVETLEHTQRADFCVGYFNLRGWQTIDTYVDKWKGGEGHCCRLLVGMQRLPDEELRLSQGISFDGMQMDNQTAKRMKDKLAKEFRQQLTYGTPTNQDELGLRNLSRQIKAKKLSVKLFLRHPLHAKLYLLFRPDPINPTVGYLGSSNLTMRGLSQQGELNIDVLDHDACAKLATWFECRWSDRWCFDISDELVEIIDESWAREKAIPPYHIYIKIAYHLAREARAGLTDFRIPSDFNGKLLDFQIAAVKIAAHHLNVRGGVMIGDVVGLGKTLMATALARVFEDDHGLETLILCPKNLVPMWEDYKDRFRLRARVLSISRVIKELPKLRRFRLLVVDESQNLRNKEGKRFRAIREYVNENDCKCILLSATPYNKTYEDLSTQLNLFVSNEQDLGIRPDALLREIGKTEFNRQYQAPIRSLTAFEKSKHADDWRELMRLYLVRRTRSFIQANYAETDPANGRKFLRFEDGTKSYFPVRIPKTIKFEVDDQYRQLFTDDVVEAITGLKLPRYGLAKYVSQDNGKLPTDKEQGVLDSLTRAGRRLMGFCRTNLFKRLESSGHAFLLSVERHVLRNYVFLYAIENQLDLPIGSTDAGMLDTQSFDEDSDGIVGSNSEDDDEDEQDDSTVSTSGPRSEADFRTRAEEIYRQFADRYRNRFDWVSSRHFDDNLRNHLEADAQVLCAMLENFGNWEPKKDAKLTALQQLLEVRHKEQKVLVFSQFADTIGYINNQLSSRGVKRMAAVTGSDDDPTQQAWRFSPKSNGKDGEIQPYEELRILNSTDVLSEGQNLQDCAIVVNYDLPWAIIRLVQRAGRVDRIGQKAHEILCYSFLPADGVEQLIRLRSRVRTRLDENEEVIGTDEAFFEDEDKRTVRDLYSENAGILDGTDETEVDLSSYAYQIWQNAIKKDPSLKKKIEELPSVVYSSKLYEAKKDRPEGALVYLRTGQENDALAWVDQSGKSVTENQFEILQAARCRPGEPAGNRRKNHHELVRSASEHIADAEQRSVGGQLGRPSDARFKVYVRLDKYVKNINDSRVDTTALRGTIDEIYRWPLREAAVDIFNRQLRSSIADEALAKLAIQLREEDRLCVVQDDDERQDPQLICSLGLVGQ